ncbi:MAG: T9SS type A sorting domain-containing protein [Phaeodactylibacter sp.]|nr:T9SS type A sorting domain-containing protein [Phaeodactylibacter sp.]
MKKVILLFLGWITWSVADAQETTCEPNQAVPDSVVVAPLPQSPTRPGGGIADTACANEYYRYVFTFNIPETYDYLGNMVPLQNVSIAPDGAVVNMPASFDYVCNPPNCVFNPLTKGCVVIFGTPAPGDVGVHDLKVDVDVALNVGFPFTLPLALPDDLEANSHYYLIVKPEGSANCFSLDAYESFASKFRIQNLPNPTSGWTQIQVSAETGGTFDFFVSDLLGQRLHRERVTILPGENTIDFDGSHLPNGMYLYSLSNGREMVTRRMAISRQ